MAPSGGACELVTNTSCVDAQGGGHFMKKPSDCLVAAGLALQSDSQLDSTLVDNIVYMFDKTESFPDCKQEKEPAEDNLDAIGDTNRKIQINARLTLYPQGAFIWAFDRLSC
jgi:hypothetical protein